MSKVKIIPLGGLGEVGKNMTVIEFDDEIYIVDAGIAFPDEEMLGVDVVIPNFDYLRENKAKIKGIFITHGHEDHIGALPYFLKEFDVPLYATKLTIAFIRNKLKYARFSHKKMNIINKNSVLEFGKTKVEFFSVIHSIPDAVGVIVKTPLGQVVHTGDFKIDYTPLDKNFLDFQRLGEIGNKGVLALLSDSTNAIKEGASPSEKKVGKNLEEEIKKTNGRTIVATFSSSLHRVQNLFMIAERLNKKIVILGKRMEDNIKTANKLGHIVFDKDTMVKAKEMDKYEDDDLLIVTTGAQGETLAGLTRMATDSHKFLTLNPNDTIIFSSSAIPGNEKKINTLINMLLKKGVYVVDKKGIHTSGHGYQEEQKLLLSIFRPKYFIPAHGEYRMLMEHAKMAEEVGIKASNIAVCENGDVIQVDEHKMQVINKVNTVPVLVDNSGLGDVNTSIMRDRQRMAEHGICIIQAKINEQTSRLKTTINFKGIVAKYDKHSMEREVGTLIKEKNKNIKHIGKLKRELYGDIGDVIYKNIKRKPMIVLLINIEKDRIK